MPDRSSNPLSCMKALVKKKGTAAKESDARDRSSRRSPKHTKESTDHSPKIPAPRKPVEEHKHRKQKEGK